jgi:GDP-mannose 6-dehydrogenase
MRISVFGLGYVGSVSAACFAARGHEVVGVDSNPSKVKLVARGEPPVQEPGLPELLADTVRRGLLTATEDGELAVRDTDVSLICVGTPSAANGSLDTDALERVLETIGGALRKREGRHTVVIRSTTLPGTCDGLVVPVLERASGLRAGADFGVAVNPEFLREGSSVADFNDPGKIVIGELDASSGDVVASMYEGVPGAVFRVEPRVAEMAKYTDNAFHALKITFANEIGAACRAFGIDSHELMRITRSDTKLNISTAYLTPGFAFGGSCLPKDLRALLYATRREDLDLPLLESILPSNERQLARAVDLVMRSGRKRIGLFGLSFKPETDDLRESALVELAERLLGKGFDLKIYDPGVSLARLVGANREFIQTHIPHLATLLVDSADEVVEHAEVCVVGADRPETVAALARANGREVIDLVRLSNGGGRTDAHTYVGIAW